MQRSVSKVQVGEYFKNGDIVPKYRYSLLIKDDTPLTTDIRAKQIAFLQELVNQPSLLSCGPSFVKDFRIYYSEDCWMLSGSTEGYEKAE